MRPVKRTTALGKYALLEAEGEYFDGETARGREVIVKFGESSLTLLGADDTPIAHWALASLTALDGRGGVDELRLAPEIQGDERLTIRDSEMIAAIRAVCPDLDKRPHPPGALRKIALWGAAAVASVLLIVFVLVPALAERLAPMIPLAQEQKMGAQVIAQITRFIGEGEAGFCESPEGLAALNRMTARLEEQADSYAPLAIRVFDDDLENAFTAPGGHIVLLKGLIASAQSPDEVAAVLAHEIGHVIHRDPTREALRAAGSAGVLGLLVGDFTGGALMVAVTERVMNASYQQDAETAADEAAHEILARAGLPASALADFFTRLRDEHGDATGLMSYVASHPGLVARAEAARAADVIGDAPFIPALDDGDWIALQQICD